MDDDALISSYCDGRLAPADCDRLFVRVAEDVAMARRFADLVATHHALGRLAALESERETTRIQLRRRRRPVALVAGCLLVAGSLLAVLLAWPGDPLADWQVDGAGRDLLVAGQPFAAAVDTRLVLADGSTLTVAAGSAVVPLPEGGPARLRLVHGSLTAAIATQDPARPFVIATPHGRCTVLGTRFEVASHSGGSVVRVLEGRVAVAFGGRSERILGPGEVLRDHQALPTGLVPPMERRFLEAAIVDEELLTGARRWLGASPGWAVDWHLVEEPERLFSSDGVTPVARVAELAGLGQQVLVATPRAADAAWHRRLASQWAQRWPAATGLCLLFGRPQGGDHIAGLVEHSRIWRDAFNATGCSLAIAWSLQNDKDLAVVGHLDRAPVAQHPDLLMLRGYLGIGGQLPDTVDPTAPGEAAIVAAMHASVARFSATLAELRQQFAPYDLRLGVFDCGLHIWDVPRAIRDGVYRPVLYHADQAPVYQTLWRAFPANQGPCQIWLPWWLYRKEPADGAWTDLDLGMSRAAPTIP